MSKGGGGGGGKKGGGSPQVPKVNLNPGETTQQQTLTDLAQYESQMLPTFESMGNWAANLATGGAAIPITELSFGEEPYKTNQLARFGTPSSPATGIPGITLQGAEGAITGPGGQGGGGGSSGMVSSGGIAPSAGAGSFFGASPTSGQFSDLKPVYNSAGNYIGYQNPEGQFFTKESISADTLGVPNFALPPGAQGGGQAQGAATGAGGGAAAQPSGIGGALNTEWQNIVNAENVIPQIQGIQSETAGLQGSVNQEVSALQPTETGALLPGQQAMIDAAVNSGKAQLNQTLSSQGLGPSTMGAELGAEIGLQGAAVGGELEQGNIQLLQSAQKLAAGTQELSLGEEGALFSQFSSIAQQAGGVQSQLYSEALQGYGMLGNFLNSIVSAYGVNVQAYGDELNAEAASASDQTSLEIAELQSQQSQSSMMGGLFQGLGSILGAGGSSGIGAALGGLISAF